MFQGLPGRILPRVLVKLRHFGHELPVPKPFEKDGLELLNADALGELVRVTDKKLADACERMVGELSMSIFPLGVIVEVDAPNERMNGLWVQRAIFELAVKNVAGTAAAA